jgi:hypothetical protein
MHTEEGLRLARWIAEKVAAGELTREQAERELAEQFPEDCDACRTRYDETLAALYAPAPEGIVSLRRYASRLSKVLAPVPAANHVVGTLAKKKRTRVLPRAVLVERSLAAFSKLLEPQSWHRRRERVHLEWHRFRGVEVANLMLGEALAALPGQPADSKEWAELVLMALSGSRGRDQESPEAVLLRLRARLLVANAARCRGELDEAADEMTFLLRAAGDLDVRNLAFWAEAKSQLSALRRNQRDFAAAAQAARETHALARHAGLLKGQLRAAWQLASIHELQGNYPAALQALRLALPGVASAADPVLEMGIRHFEVSILARAQCFEEAEQAYLALGPLYDKLRDRENYRAWVWASIAAGLGRRAEAEAAFRSAREGFLDQKNAYDAALVTLDLSLFLIDQGRAEEVLALAVSMGQAFEALGIARETMAAWAVFQTAAERRELDRAVAEQLVRALGEERSAPQAR